MITHLEQDILECKVKWALGSITTNKASGDDGIPVELFQILKDDALKMLRSICQQIFKTQQWPQDWKRSVFIPVPKKGNANECSDYHLRKYQIEFFRQEENDQCIKLEVQEVIKSKDNANIWINLNVYDSVIYIYIYFMKRWVQ